MTENRRIAVVPARYGPNIIGGAEIVLAQIAHRMIDRGWDVEVLTSCALDYFNWENSAPAGVAVEDGITVRRFEVHLPHQPEVRSYIGHQILAGVEVPIQEQMRWMNADVRIPDLFSYLLQHASDYRAIIFGPYLFWPAFACSQIAPDRSLLWTCLHDEPESRLELFEPVLSGIAGLFLQTDPEHELAHRVNKSLAPHEVVGCGVEVPETYDGEGFRERYGIDGDFILYAGRREGAKGWNELLDSFTRVIRERDLPLKLVTMGAGPVEPAADVADRVIDLGFLPDHERDNAYAAASAYVQPSRNEAFSRTIMESWLAGTPVVGIGQGGVVRWHIERSRAGIVYNDDFELDEALTFIAREPELARELGSAGRSYVLANYQWDDVINRIEKALLGWTR